MEKKEIRKQDIIDQLVWDERVDANDVIVHIENDVVQLKGKVPTLGAKLAASDDAYMIDGVVNVDNQIEVERTERKDIPADDEISSNILRMLLWNDNIASTDISVKSKNGIITLSGEVNSYRAKTEAEKTAASVVGVTDVINLLEVHIERTLTDADIEADIENAFRRNAVLNHKNIAINVKKGIVKLSGTVTSYDEKRIALDLANRTSGVTNVEDKLVIQYKKM